MNTVRAKSPYDCADAPMSPMWAKRPYGCADAPMSPMWAKKPYRRVTTVRLRQLE